MHMIYTGFFSSILQIMSLTDFNRKIAYVAQDNYLFNESVRENIRQGNPDAPIVIFRWDILIPTASVRFLLLRQIPWKCSVTLQQEW